MTGILGALFTAYIGIKVVDATGKITRKTIGGNQMKKYSFKLKGKTKANWVNIVAKNKAEAVLELKKTKPVYRNCKTTDLLCKVWPTKR